MRHAVGAQCGEFGHPASHIGSIGIKVPRLCHWIEDAEVRLRVAARGGCPLPAAVVGGEVMVDRSALRAPTMTIIGSGHTTYLDNSSLTATEGAMDIFDSVVVQGTSSITSPTYIDIQRAPAVSGSGSINANPAGTAPDILNLTAGARWMSM